MKQDRSIAYRKGYHYTLAEPYHFFTRCRPDKNVVTSHISLDIDGNGRLAVGYAWDGATMAFDTLSFLRASAGHDAKYQLIREGYLPPECKDIADDELCDDARMDGMTAIRRWYVRKAMWFSMGATRPSASRPILRAP